MKCGCYARVSTEDQSLESQVSRMEQHCKSQGWTYEVFKETASGKTDSRTELGELMKRIRSGDFEMLMVCKLDRLGRSLQHLLQIMSELANRKVSFISLSEGFNTSTPQGRFFFQIAGSFAEFERSLISERTEASLAFRKANGQVVGRPLGSKDKKPRRKAGYYARWLKER